MAQHVDDHSHLPVPDSDEDAVDANGDIVGDVGGTMYHAEDQQRRDVAPSDLPVALSVTEMLARLRAPKRSICSHADWPLIRDHVFFMCRAYHTDGDVSAMCTLSRTFTYTGFTDPQGALQYIVDTRNVIGHYEVSGDVGGVGGTA